MELRLKGVNEEEFKKFEELMEDDSFAEKFESTESVAEAKDLLEKNDVYLSEDELYEFRDACNAAQAHPDEEVSSEALESVTGGGFYFTWNYKKGYIKIGWK